MIEEGVVLVDLQHLDAQSAEDARRELLHIGSLANVRLLFDLDTDVSTAVAIVRPGRSSESGDGEWIATVREPDDSSSVRVSRSTLAEVLTNLSLANLDVDDYRRAADQDDVFRGWQEVEIPENALVRRDPRTGKLLDHEEHPVIVIEC